MTAIECFSPGDPDLNPSPRLTQSFAGRVREHLAEIEARLYVGVPRAGVLEEFRQRGIDLGTLQSFPSALYRARRSAARPARTTQPVQGAESPLIDETRATAALSPASTLEKRSDTAHDYRPIGAVLGSPPDTEALATELLARQAVGMPSPPEFKYGAHDPRRIDEVMRRTPDLKAYAKLAKRTRQP